MKDLVLIPCFQRPEFLSICLEQIAKAEGAENYTYAFLLDRGFHKDNLRVIERFPFEKGIQIRSVTVPGIGKQSMNLLEGYRFACELPIKKVFLIEEDILISNDFFKWHEKVHYKEKLLCSIATENNNTPHISEGNLSKYYIGDKRDFQSLGICWDKEALKKFIVPHAKYDYYKNPRAYIAHNFKGSVMAPDHHCEQDGLIRRVRELYCDLNVIFPDVPRAYHAGYYGYNRPSNKIPRGLLQEKIKHLKEIIFSPEKMQENSIPGYYEDSKPINLINELWLNQTRQECEIQNH